MKVDLLRRCRRALSVGAVVALSLLCVGEAWSKPVPPKSPLWSKTVRHVRLVRPGLWWPFQDLVGRASYHRWIAQTTQPEKDDDAKTLAEISAKAEKIGIETGGLSLRDVLNRLIRDNPSLKRERLLLRIASADLTRARGAFSFDLNLDLTLGHIYEPQGIQNFLTGGASINVDTFREGWSVDGNIQLNKRFESGTALSATFTNRWADTNRLFYDLQGNALTDRNVRIETVNSSLTLQATQSFLKGAFLEPNLAPIWQAEEGMRKVQDQLAGVVTQYAAQAIRAYWDLVYARANRQIQEGALKLAEEQLRTTQALIQGGKKSPLERYEAEQAVAKRKGDLLQAENSLDDAVTSLRTLLAMENGGGIAPSEAPAIQAEIPDLPKLLKEVERSSFELMAAKRDIRIAKLALLVSKNATLPQLDFTLGFTFRGLGNTVQGAANNLQPFPRAYGTLFDPSTHNFQAGVVLRIPLDNRQATALHERQQVEARRAEMQLDVLKQQLRLELRKLYAIAMRTKQRIPIARVSLLLAQKKLEAEQLRYKLGQSTLFTLLQYQQDLATAQLEEVKARVDLQKATIAIYERAGLLLSKYGIAQKRD
ncbi:MAG: TolC family protein [Myxococcales bacterium]|nr:TolC family protein [Myxococcales bacterium]